MVENMAKKTVHNIVTSLILSFLIYSFLKTSQASARDDENDKEPKKFLFEGDIAGLELDAVESTDALKDGAKNSVMDEKLRWSHRIIPFELSDRYENSARKIIWEAVRGFNSLTCLKFVPRMDEETYVRIAPGIGCSSEIGKLGGKQIISIAKSCLKKGIIQHELMHLLGFYHEQARQDRDNYVDINYDNIDPSDKIQFKKYIGNMFDQPYDFGSVMHYGETDFAKDKNIWTIRPKTPYTGRRIGQRDGLSKTDIKKINLMYKCADQLKEVADEQYTESPTRSEELSVAQRNTRQLIEVFRDDFNDQSIDIQKWSVYDFSSSIAIQRFASDDVWEGSGFMFIRSQRREYSGRNFTSGIVDTNAKFKFLYGEVEWRARLSGGQGIASYLSIRTQNKDTAINIAARGNLKDVIQPAVFYKSQLGTSEISFQDIYGADDTVGNFHTFKIIWEPDQIIWLVDGRQIWNMTDSEKIPHQEGYLNMEQDVGQAWTGPPDSTTPFPTRMLIDYVTVYQWR